MKKSSFTISALVVIALAWIIFAQAGWATTVLTVVEKMKAALHDFSLSNELNPWQTGLKSWPLSGKLTWWMVTAEEYNRILEMLSAWGEWTGENRFEIVDATSGWSIWTNGTTKAASCPSGYVGVFGLSHYYDTNNGVQYHGVGTCNWNTDRTQCSSINSDAGITEGAVQITCIKWSRGTGGSWWSLSKSSMLPGWPDAIVCTASDEKNVIFYNSGENSNASEIVYFTRFTSSPGWFMHFNSDKSFKSGESKFDCNGKSIQQLIDAKKTFNFVGGNWTGGGSWWVDVPLTDTADFDIDCDYKFQLGDGTTTYSLVASYILPIRITSTASNCHIHIASWTKNAFSIWWSGCTWPWFTVRKIQKRCDWSSAVPPIPVITTPCWNKDDVKSIAADGTITCRNDSVDSTKATGMQFLGACGNGGCWCMSGTYDWRCENVPYTRYGCGGWAYEAVCPVRFNYGTNTGIQTNTQCGSFTLVNSTSAIFCTW